MNMNVNYNRDVDDIRRLRAEGVTDDEILNNYREYAPHHAADIDKILSEGANATEIIDTVIWQPSGDARVSISEGFLQSSGKALQYGSGQAAAGLGRTAVRLGELTGIDMAKTGGEALETLGKGLLPQGYKPASADFFDPQGSDKGLGGFGWRHLPRTVIESAPGLAMDIGAGAATGGGGFLASNAARSFGPAVDERVRNNGGREASGSDYALAGASSALNAYLNKVGMNPALTGVTKGAGMAALAQIPGQIAKAGAVDAATGVAGNVIDQAAVTAGTDKGLSLDAHQALGSGLASGATGVRRHDKLPP
jgi:hypothetical protein